MMGAIPSLDAAFDDDEDTARGDAFDHLTPREVSFARYRQNHEWIEEVLSSPYRMNQIVVPDLGLGLKGELAPLTDGIFYAPGAEAPTDKPKNPYAGRLDGDMADQFRKRVNEKIEATLAEIEAMKADHANQLAKLESNEVLKNAVKDIKTAVEETGPEFWRLEGRLEDTEEGIVRGGDANFKKVDDILAGVETSISKKAEVVHDVSRIQDGGYQEPAPEPEPEPEPVPQPPRVMLEAPGNGASASMSRQPSHNGSQHSGIMIGDSDIDMGGTAAGLLDQMHGGFSSTSTPMNSFPTPQPHLSAIPSAAATPAHEAMPSPHPGSTLGQGAVPQHAAGAGEDVKMHDGMKGEATTPDQGTGSGDWVVVPKDGGPQPSASANPAAQPESYMPASTSAAESAVPAAVTEAAGEASKPASAAPTPGDGLTFDSSGGDNNDFGSLDDLDTAGEALAGYDPPSIPDGVGGDEPLELNMDMDDSAFGDAFHGVEQQSAGNTPADGGL
jgi:hypothetical protein